MKFQKIKFIATLAMLTIGTVSCSSCAKKLPDPVVVDSGADSGVDAGVDAGQDTDSAVPGPMTIKGDKWEFTLPSAAWRKMDGAPENTVAFVNEAVKNIVLLVDEPFTGAFDEYALNAIRGVRSAGALVASAKQVEVNGHKFVLVESSKNGMRIWMWVTTKDGRGYGLSCGGPDDSNHRSLCFGIADTLKIN